MWPLLRPRAARRVDRTNRPRAVDGRAIAIRSDRSTPTSPPVRLRATSARPGSDELAARLGAELQTAKTPAPASSPRSPLIAALILVAALPAAALLLYVSFGNPDAMRVAAKAGERAPMTQEQVVAMVESLAARMKAQPEDPTGWKLLARAYAAMGRYPEATAAFKEAATRSPQEDASLLADWADAQAMRDHSLQGEPSRLVSRALTLDPNHPKALALAATAALEHKDYDGAIAQWHKLQAQFPPGSEEVQQIGAMIAEANTAKNGGSGSVPVDASAVTGRVSLDPKLRERAAPGDTLFVYARAANGPRMPVAIVRKPASALPLAFRLDDSQAMTPAARLSTSGEVIVEARISKSGSAAPAAGDLRGSSAPVRPGARDVNIVIDDVVR